MWILSILIALRPITSTPLTTGQSVGFGLLIYAAILGFVVVIVKRRIEKLKQRFINNKKQIEEQQNTELDEVRHDHGNSEESKPDKNRI